jgi:PBP1b-binding outer membrane lipoprotein LpoB
MSRKYLALIVALTLTVLCSGCYTEVHEADSYNVETFKMTEPVKTPDMTVKRPQQKKSDWTNLWGLF